MKQAVSRSELKRLRYVLELDWPGIDDAIIDLENHLHTDKNVKNAKKLVAVSVDDALEGYRQTIYAVSYLGKLSDPIRLATFVYCLLNSLINRLKGSEWKKACAATESNSSDQDCRKRLYEKFISGTIRESLRESGHEQKILVGSGNNLLSTDTCYSHFYTNGLGN